MNRLNATTHSSWGGGSFLDFVYVLIDSKIDSMELRTRKLLEKFNRIEEKVARLNEKKPETGQSDNTSLHDALSEVLFSHYEELSCSISRLNDIKLALREDNVNSVMYLLEDDKYLRVSKLQLSNVLEAAQAA